MGGARTAASCLPASDVSRDGSRSAGCHLESATPCRSYAPRHVGKLGGARTAPSSRPASDVSRDGSSSATCHLQNGTTRLQSGTARPVGKGTSEGTATCVFDAARSHCVVIDSRRATHASAVTQARLLMYCDHSAKRFAMAPSVSIGCWRYLVLRASMGLRRQRACLLGEQGRSLGIGGVTKVWQSRRAPWRR